MLINIFIIVLIILILMVLIEHNRFVRLKNNIKRDESGIDVYLNQRPIPIKYLIIVNLSFKKFNLKFIFYKIEKK